MSHSTTIAHSAASRAQPHRSGPLVRTLFVTAVLSASAGVLATLALERISFATTVPQLAPVASLPPAASAVRDPSVPDASTVFGSGARTPDEPPPSF
jgi:hypothetical protein